MSLVSQILANRPENDDKLKKLWGIHQKYKLLSDAAHGLGGTAEDWVSIYNEIYTRSDGGDKTVVVDLAGALSQSFELRYRGGLSYQESVEAFIYDLATLVKDVFGDDINTDIDWMSKNWYSRNADYRNPNAFIHTNPSYFASECSSAIMAGKLVPTDGH